MTTNESSGLTKYKLKLMDTGQAGMGNQQGDRGGLAKGAGCGQRKMGQAGTWGELTGNKRRQSGGQGKTPQN